MPEQQTAALVQPIQPPADEYLDSQVDVILPEPAVKPLTPREEAIISSMKCECLEYTSKHVLLHTTLKKTQLWWVYERRGRYMQFKRNFTTEKEGRAYFGSLA